MRKTRRFILGSLLAAVLTIAVATPAFAAGFSDIDGSPFEASINALAYRGYIGGFADGSFKPDAQVTRQQFAKMIVKTLDITVTGSEDCKFVDVSKAPTGTDAFYPAKYVAVCALNNITKGTDATHFSPGLNIKRAQIISMVVRAADNLAAGTLQTPEAGWTGALPATSYSDPTHGPNIKKAEFNGLLARMNLATWDTTAYATRGETAEILAQLFYRTGVVLTLTGPSGTQEFTLAEFKALPSAQGYGGWKNSVNNVTGPRPYKGVSIAALMSLVGGGTTVTVTASDRYAANYAAGDVAGHPEKVFDPITKTQIANYPGNLTMVLAYEADGQKLSSSEGLLRIGFISAAADQVTDSKLWASQVAMIEVH
jgi:hypothetical protein